MIRDAGFGGSGRLYLRGNLLERAGEQGESFVVVLTLGSTTLLLFPDPDPSLIPKGTPSSHPSGTPEHPPLTPFQ